MLALTINAVMFDPIIDNKYMLMLRTDNKGVKTNIIKHRFKNCWYSLGLCRYLFFFGIANKLHIRVKNVVRTENKEADTLSKIDFQLFKKLMLDNHGSQFDSMVRLTAHLDKVLNTHIYYNDMF